MARDSGNLSTLLIFAKKLVVSGADVFQKWWQREQRRPGGEVDPSKLPGDPAASTRFPLALQARFSCSGTEGDTQK